ncbi:Os10g0149100 [Oryza sativa Japonica Group]|uniref:Os10g0149100 protein n=1 Tax=Oryza sativa subsp. japonica TaxID=39947 RepID=Q93WF4_ORYSJ|nr:Putative proline-rich protein [Oryza sativa]AAK91887.1 Putative proline-rich protein [Oryza sativa]BAH94751.1 Os10g0149100 [Oryza sativa Japonica Group]|eukprot:NP_001176023.1 Os10g0149100 [Oryza sativa Japonica Group]
MAAVARALLFAAIVCTALVMAVTAAADGEAAAIVVGLAKCGDCSSKNMKGQDAFKGLQVAIKCRNGDGDVPLAADDLHGAADCFAQLHSATSSTPCPGQEPSKIVPLSSTTDNGVDKANTFVAVAGKRMYSSTSPAECTSAFLYDYFHKHPFFDYFHKKPQGPEPKPDPKPTPLPANGGGGGAGNGGGGAQGNSGGAAPSPSSPPVYH